MSRIVCNEVRSIRTLNDQQLDEQALHGEEPEALKREDKAKLNTTEYVPYDKDLSKATVQNKNPQDEIENGTPTFLEKVNGTPHTGKLEAQKTTFGGMLTISKTLIVDSGQQTTVGEHNTPGGDGNNALNRYNGAH